MRLALIIESNEMQQFWESGDFENFCCISLSSMIETVALVIEIAALIVEALTLIIELNDMQRFWGIV